MAIYLQNVESCCVLTVEDEEAKIDDSIVNFVFHDMRPFAMVDGVGFTRMVKCLNPKYSIKARNTYHAKAVVT